MIAAFRWYTAGFATFSAALIDAVAWGRQLRVRKWLVRHDPPPFSIAALRKPVGSLRPADAFQPVRNFSSKAPAIRIHEACKAPCWRGATGGGSVYNAGSTTRLPDPAGAPGPSEPIALLCLGAGLFLGWSALFYLFGALLLPWELETALSKAELSLGLTAAILVSALMAPVFGRVIDDGHGRLLLGGGALVGALGLAGLSVSTGHKSFVLAWMVIGAGQGACLFESTFAFLARVMRQRARSAILLVGLIGGFATLLAYPGAAVLTELYGWRIAVGTFALMTAVIMAPLMYTGGALLEPASLKLDRETRNRAGRLALASARKRPAFWGLMISFALLAFAEGLTLSHAVSAMVEFGQVEALALLAMTMLGPCMAAGRFCMLWFKPNGASFAISIIAALGMAVGIALLPFVGEHAGIGLVAMAVFGLGYGLIIVLKPILVSECLGYLSIGAILGALALPCFTALASAPYSGALLWERGGYDLAILVATIAATLGALGLVAVALSRRG